MKNNDLLEYQDKPLYSLFLDKIITCGTSDPIFFDGYGDSKGNYKAQQIPCEFAAFLTWLHEYAINKNPIYYMEIGSCAGGSLRHVYEALNGVRLFSVDNMSYFETAYQTFNFEILNHCLSRFTGDSHSNKFDDWLKSWQMQWDIIFIDGDHMKNGVISDLLKVKNYVKDYVVFHDTVFTNEVCQVPEAIRWLEVNGHIKIHKHFENPNGKKLGISIYRCMYEN